MALEKIDIIEGTLAQQVAKFAQVAEIMRKEMNEHQGAMEALNQLAKQMPSFMTSIEERIEKDTDLGNAAASVLTYSKNIIARFMAMCEANARNQHQQRFMAEGRMQMAEQTVANLRKEIETQKAVAAKREAESEAQRAAYRGDADGTTDETPATNGKRARTTKKGSKPRKPRASRKKSAN